MLAALAISRVAPSAAAESIVDSMECNLASDLNVSARTQVGTSDRQSSVVKYRYSAARDSRFICVMDVICRSRTESTERSEPTRMAVACAEREDRLCPSIRDCIEANGLETVPGSLPAADAAASRPGADPKRARGPSAIKNLIKRTGA